MQQESLSKQKSSRSNEVSRTKDVVEKNIVPGTSQNLPSTSTSKSENRKPVVQGSKSPVWISTGKSSSNPLVKQKLILFNKGPSKEDNVSKKLYLEPRKIRHPRPNQITGKERPVPI
ncbi:hypothetical protein QAD02_012030 [Eretmocerus hayati]|uniref:Uncharacterized protein n=1 Tax=Eretmocerus hayati TaxID=131215 RepID=A0ACC2NYV9_9HYME|nr:hypothetical protein QAD02_012030 [Eretmocerus hayati]